MAAAIAAEYDATIPGVVYNVFPLADSASADREYKDRKNRNIPSVHWFSQTIGPGRGLELLFLAAQSIAPPFEIHLRGTLLGGYAEWLKSIITPRLRERVFIHDVVPNDALLSRISEHDIGLALETSAIRSRNLTITNKLFQYLQSGLAVIATNTAGQKEVFAQTPNIGMLISDNDVTGLAHALTELFGNSKHLQDAKEAALAAFNEKFCWEHQSETVVRLVDSALAR
jgi:glycosyltransferase involved in cell wall biosynthesis